MTRHEKYRAFSDFASEANARFHEMMEEDTRAKELSARYSFYVRSGNQSDVDERTVTISFGDRPVSTTDNGRRLLAESGAALHYSQAEDGSVACFVYPARTERRTPLDEVVMIWHYDDPTILSYYEPVANDFSFFISHAVWSGLDCSPSLWDRLRVNLTLLFSRTQRDGQMKRHRLHKILHWIGYAGLSGTLIAVLTSWLKG